MITKLKLLAFYLCFSALNAFGQTTFINRDTLQTRLDLYAKASNETLLFVHTDKTLYTNNEPVWFTGYLINSGYVYQKDHTIISVSLMREDDRKIIAEQRNVMQDGLGSGSLIIPDNAPPGNYLFNAITNVLDRNGKPAAVFSQPLTVKSISQRNFSATLALLDTVPVNGNIRASVIVDIKDIKRKGNAVISYVAAGGKTESITLVDNASSANINIPAAQLTGIDPVLLTQISYLFDTLYLSVKLPKLEAKGLNAQFFAEGGSLIDGLESTVAVELLTTTGLPVAANGTVYKDDNPIAAVATNYYGVGKFVLKPEKGSRYTFRVKKDNVYLNGDTAYALPGIVENGVVMHFGRAVINDTLKVTLYSKTPRTVQVLVHNYKEAFSLFNAEVIPAGKKLSLVLPTLPKGIATITVLDEQGRPLAERLFFAHHDDKISAQIRTDKLVHNKRDSVALTISLKDKAGMPVRGLISVAAVQENRLEATKLQDIESYVYLTNDLGALPRVATGRPINNKDYLEDMFMTRGWRRYKWQDMMQSSEADALIPGKQQVYKGAITSDGKALKKPFNMVIIRGSDVQPDTTAKDGSFIFSENEITIEEGKKVHLWLGNGNLTGLAVNVDDPFLRISRQVADAAVLAVRGTAAVAESSTDQQLKDLEKAIVLNVVDIKAKKDDGIYGYMPNACGDYVCVNNYLNCYGHPPHVSKVRQPVKGEWLRVHGGGDVIYKGCTSNGPSIPAIYTAREFYGLNREPGAELEPQYLSTLFWKPGVVTNEKGEASLSFFTGDITGKFKLVVQGIGGNDMVYGEQEFTVK